MKYVKRSGKVSIDFEHYLGQEGLYHYFFGHKLSKSEKQKVKYIFVRLCKVHKQT